MARITEDLVRRRAEHNNCELSTLEELSLHQQDIEKIEHLDKWCRELKILYLQNNLIPRIENVGRLKQLEYLNLALNNVTRIENLEGCECLEKLDLTVNFVADLLSVESLRHNAHFRELYLTGNPCTDYEGYREFVVAALPQLKWLDGKEVTRSERILATQKLDKLRHSISQQQIQYEQQREEERKKEEEEAKLKKKKKKPGFDRRWYTDPDAHVTKSGESEDKHSELEQDKGKETKDEDEEEEEEDEDFDWKKPVAYTPETRTAAHKYMAEKRSEKAPEPKKPDLHKRVRRLERDGKMLNVNEGKYEFSIVEKEENNQFVLEVNCPKFMDTSLIDCDVQPTYVRVTIKGKVLQIVLQEEVSPDKSTARRSQTTGALVVTMHKVKSVLKPKNNPPSKTLVQNPSSKTLVQKPVKSSDSHIQRLEVPDKPATSLLNIMNNVGTSSEHNRTSRKLEQRHHRPPPPHSMEGSESFVDDPDIPPLI